MDEQDTTTTRFYIEALRTVRAVNNMTGRFGDGWDTPFDAWVPVGTIEIEAGELGALPRDAFAAWIGEQTEEPPVGDYRVIKNESYGSTFQTYNIAERTEREITRVEGPAEQQLRDDIRELSMAARTPAEGSDAA